MVLPVLFIDVGTYFLAKRRFQKGPHLIGLIMTFFVVVYCTFKSIKIVENYVAKNMDEKSIIMPILLFLLAITIIFTIGLTRKIEKKYSKKD